MESTLLLESCGALSASSNFGVSESKLLIGIIDVNLSVAVTCVPALKPLLARWLPRLFRGDTTPKENVTPRSRTTTDFSSSSPVKQANDKIYSNNTLQVTEISFNQMFSVPTTTDIGVSSFAAIPEDVEASVPAEPKEMEVTGTDVDFVVLKERNTLHDVPGSQSWRYLWRTAILYALIGFTNSFAEALARAAKTQNHISSSVELLNRNVFYGAYLVGPSLVAFTTIRIWSFKGTSISGLLVLAVGCLIFWPAAILGPTPGGIGVSYFTIGAGKSMQHALKIYNADIYRHVYHRNWSNAVLFLGRSTCKSSSHFLDVSY